MKAWLVTSTLTFVPENYNRFILKIAQHPDIVGLIMIENRSWKFLSQGVLLLLSGIAPSLGWNLMKNTLCPGISSRKKYYVSNKKKVRVVHDLNAPEFLTWLLDQEPDLLINARTRTLFKSKLLAIPKMGCWNIHHGLLPDQRGLMCDFWAQLDNQDFGFSIHQMTDKLDSGTILKKCSMLTATMSSSYTENLLSTSEVEGLVLGELLDQLKREGQLTGTENLASEKTRYFKNPTWMDLFRFRRQGKKI